MAEWPCRLLGRPPVSKLGLNCFQDIASSKKQLRLELKQKNQNTKDPQESNWMVLQTCNVMFVPLQTFANLSTARIETETKHETPFVLNRKFKHWNFLIGGLKIQRPHVVSSESVGFAFLIHSSSRTLRPPASFVLEPALAQQQVWEKQNPQSF